jgi:hypothetical protein
MSKHIQLTIADPCHENWDKMTKSEQGKFCGSCQKQVIDFTGMTDAQLVTFFKKKSTGNVCGRFYDDQLDKGIPVPRKRIPWVRYFFQYTLPLFLVSLKAKAQKGQVEVKTIQTESCKKNQPIYGNVSPLFADRFVDQGIIIKGVVVNEAGNPVPFASIEKGAVGTAADSTGTFSLIAALNPKGIKINVSSVGYESQEIELTIEQIIGKGNVIITLKQAGQMLPVVVTSGTTLRKGGVTGSITVRRWWYRSSKLFPVTPSIRVFSNPTRPRSIISIDPGKSEHGIYIIQLISMSGQLVKQEQTRIEKGINVLSFSVPAVPSGTYLVALVNKKSGKKSTEKLIVQ